METKVCQNCKFFKQPKCGVNNTFKSRKTDACDEFKINKNKGNSVVKEDTKIESEQDIINKVFGENIKTPDRPERKRSKKQRRK